MIDTNIKTCVSCQKALKGRADKKFCDDYCRNHYNNQLKSVTNNSIRNINYALKKNRHILEEILSDRETCRVSRDKLLVDGFHFKYHTHVYANKKNNTYKFCYDFGYLDLEDGSFLIVKTRN
ncbi:BTB/POZ domain-containing protein [Litoribacter populi]|uniref:BTB/POZ domain-containing protein n=1 Tax=Litoribacter populi TaxID=2598460 RepID=UPI00117DB25E|nr:BTB/POZ domain-containing protein [Litoribacter populi]